MTSDWLVLASICDCNHVAITVMEPGAYDHNNTAPGAGEVTLTGTDWRPLVVEAAQELHQQHPDCRISPMCTTAYATNSDNWPLTEAVTNALYDALDDLQHDQAMQRLIDALAGTSPEGAP